MSKRATETFTCPNCGADVQTTDHACPECGSDEQTGWSDDTIYDGLDLPDEDFSGASRKRRRYASTAIVIVVLICVLLLILMGAW